MENNYLRWTGSAIATKFLAVLLVGLMFVGCGKKSDKNQEVNQTAETTSTSKKINIVATTGIIADAVQNIGGDKFEVTALMGPGVDPHLYKASEGDVTRLARADVIVYNGLHLEGKMGEIMEKMGRKKPVIAAAELIDPTRLLSPPGFEGQHDPHIWFDLNLWADMTDKLSKKLGNLYPDQNPEILANAQIYIEAIRHLDREIKTQVAEIPQQQRVLITAHDAFGYFGNAYGIEVMGLQGISTVSEYGLADVTDMVNLIAKRKIKAIFVESSVPTKSIEAVQKGVLEKGHDVKIGGELYSDALGEEGTQAGTYLGMVKENVHTIVSALK